MRDMINFGILGCGLIASTHAMAVENLAGAALLGVADKNIDRAKAFAGERGIRAYQSYEEMLRDPEIDVVCVCTPSCFHEEGAVAALRAGKHVVLEKPMALTCESADRIIAAADESGKCLTVISQYRFSDDVAEVRELVKNGAFGKIT
ncbi:MAG: Gfo/Idh/MocA family oxidoreductase, partial [Clostridia bacterium]|nr:Gfo/Idh/MocA family oxidoreductase [Clostridia bacterium]